MKIQSFRVFSLATRGSQFATELAGVRFSVGLPLHRRSTMRRFPIHTGPARACLMSPRLVRSAVSRRSLAPFYSAIERERILFGAKSRRRRWTLIPRTLRRHCLRSSSPPARRRVDVPQTWNTGGLKAKQFCHSKQNQTVILWCYRWLLFRPLPYLSSGLLLLLFDRLRRRR